MEILTNDNNEYFGLVSDYKNGNAFRDAIIANGAEGKIAIIATLNMRPLTDHELSEGGDYWGHNDRHWIPVDVPCETSDVFYHAVETEIPVVEEEVEEEIVLSTDEQIEENLFKEENDFVFHNNDGTEDEFKEEE